MQAVLKEDPRFALVIGSNNAGVYRNFERAVALLPEACRWIAFADQDDEWAPDKLEVLIGEGVRTQSNIVFSDMAIYSASGRRLADTFWMYRRLEFQSPAAIAIANTVTGMAMLFRSSVVATAMPFPALPEPSYHDRWIALVGLARGGAALRQSKPGTVHSTWWQPYRRIEEAHKCDSFVASLLKMLCRLEHGRVAPFLAQYDPGSA